MCVMQLHVPHTVRAFSPKNQVLMPRIGFLYSRVRTSSIYNAHSLILTWLLWADRPSARSVQGVGDRFGFFISGWMMDSESGKVTADVPSDQRGSI